METRSKPFYTFSVLELASLYLPLCEIQSSIILCKLQTSRSVCSTFPHFYKINSLMHCSQNSAVHLARVIIILCNTIRSLLSLSYAVNIVVAITMLIIVVVKMQLLMCVCHSFHTPLNDLLFTSVSSPRRNALIHSIVFATQSTIHRF